MNTMALGRLMISFDEFRSLVLANKILVGYLAWWVNKIFDVGSQELVYYFALLSCLKVPGGNLSTIVYCFSLQTGKKKFVFFLWSQVKCHNSAPPQTKQGKHPDVLHVQLCTDMDDPVWDQANRHIHCILIFAGLNDLKTVIARIYGLSPSLSTFDSLEAISFP